MRWLKEHGVSNSLEEYLRLPLAVVEDCQLLADAERMGGERAEAYARAQGLRRG